jgi:flagellin-like hook-associated protein FlgL
MKQLMEELGNTAMRVKFNGNYLMGTFKARDNGTVFGSVAGVSEDTVLSPANTDVDWTFMTGPGDEDKMRILQIPIFATASHGRAIFETNETPLPIGELGALNELYTRIMRIAGAGASADENSTIASGFAPQQGQGYNAFGTVKLYVSAGVFYNEESNQADPSRLETFNELVDRALVQINEHRSYFGAFFGRLEHNVANLSALTENLSAALSRVQDTDYGAETSALTRVQILQQAATAMLAQANAMPNVVLGLLKSQ